MDVTKTFGSGCFGFILAFLMEFHFLCCRLRLSGSTAMTSRHPSHAESAPSTKRAPAAGSPRLHVQRSQSKETITIHFSALGNAEEDEEEELFLTTLSTTSNVQDDSSVVTAEEASEEMLEDVAAAEAPVAPESSQLSPSAGRHAKIPPTQTLPPPPRISERKGSSGSPTKSLSFPSGEKPFLNLVKSLSSDVESRDGAPPAAAPTIRHRQLMKNLVKVGTHKASALSTALFFLVFFSLFNLIA